MNAFHNVVAAVGFEGSGARAILSRACQVAEPADIEATCVCSHLHHKYETYSVGQFDSSADIDAAVEHSAEQYLNEICAPFGINRHRVLDGEPANALHQWAQDHADLVVIGFHRHNALASAFGRTSDHVIHGTPCDVLAVHMAEDAPAESPAVGPYSRILVAIDISTDISADSRLVMEHAQRVANACHATLAVCHVSQYHYGRLRNEDRLRLIRYAEQFGVAADDCHETSGNIATGIHGVAETLGADLVVMGTHGKHGLELIRGSTANAVLHRIDCDALAVRIH